VNCERENASPAVLASLVMPVTVNIDASVAVIVAVNVSVT
jgi:hypothetical protein